MARRAMRQLQADPPINRNQQNEGELRWLDETAGTLHQHPNRADPRTMVRVATKMFKDNEFVITPQGQPAPLLENTMTPDIMRFVQATARTRFKLKVTWGLVLYNNKTDEEMVFYDRRTTSPWFANMTAARLWTQQLEEDRLQGHMQLPNTKFSYESTQSLEVKIILSTQPLVYGIGKLPPWLRNKRGVHSLDQHMTFYVWQDAWRCILVSLQNTAKERPRDTPHNSRKLLGTACSLQSSESWRPSSTSASQLIRWMTRACSHCSTTPKRITPPA